MASPTGVINVSNVRLLRIVYAARYSVPICVLRTVKLSEAHQGRSREKAPLAEKMNWWERFANTFLQKMGYSSWVWNLDRLRNMQMKNHLSVRWSEVDIATPTSPMSKTPTST